MPPRRSRDLGASDEDIRRAEENSRIAGTEQWQRDMDSALAGTPLDTFTGSGARYERARDEAEALRNRSYWETLHDSAPTRTELTSYYEDEAALEGRPSEWGEWSDEATLGRERMGDALEAMRAWSEGGLTDTDMAMMDEASRREGMNARADREAAMSALEARGMGGSGATAASMLAAGEGAASRGSAMYTDMLAAAQQRQFDATRAMSEMASRGRSHDETRTAGMDAYNAREDAYARDVNQRNAERSDRERDSAAEAAQTEYENQERATAGITNQYSTDAGGRNSDRDRQDENNRGLMGFLGELIG